MLEEIVVCSYINHQLRTTFELTEYLQEKSLHTPPLVETMKSVLVYSGLGMYEETSAVLLRSLYSLLDVSVYKIEYVTPELIVDGKCCCIGSDTAE